jgi:hypothetical protein
MAQQLNRQNNDWPRSLLACCDTTRHIRQGDRLIEAPEGIELPDLDAARAEAINGVRACLAEAIGKGRMFGLVMRAGVPVHM